MPKNYFAQYFLFSPDEFSRLGLEHGHDEIITDGIFDYDAWGFVRTKSATEGAAKTKFEKFAEDPTSIKDSFTEQQSLLYADHRIFLETKVYESKEAVNHLSKPLIGVYDLK